MTEVAVPYQLFFYSSMGAVAVLMTIEELATVAGRPIWRGLVGVLLVVALVPAAIVFPYSPKDEYVIGFHPVILIYSVFMMWPTLLSMVARSLSEKLLRRPAKLIGFAYLSLRLATILVLLIINVAWVIWTTTLNV